SVVSTVTWVSLPLSSSTERTEADAVPAPLVSLPDASRLTTPATGSRSTNRAVPVYVMLIGPTLTLILPRISSPSTESRVAPGMHGATLSTSSSTSQARSLGTGTVNECSSSILLGSCRRCQCSAGQHPREVAPVVGAPVQVC